MKTVYLSLGSNLGDRAAILDRAIEELNASGVRVTRRSPIYETEPQGFAAQGWFLNAVVEAETALFPQQLLKRVQAIERKLGRKRTFRNAPRAIDIDIILLNAAVVKTADLEIPHPRYRERRFVLAPLADLAPELRDPVTRSTVREMLAEVKGQGVRLHRDV